MAREVTLKDKDGILYPQIGPEQIKADNIDFDESFIPGQLLVATRNYTTLAASNWSNYTVWSAGDWEQYGPMAESTYPHVLRVKNTTGKTMVVELLLVCSSVNVPNSRVHCTGIVDLTNASDSGSTWINLLGQTILSSNGGQTNIWAPAVVRKLEKIPPNSTRLFCPVVQCNGTGGYWLGGDWSHPSGLTTSFGGDACHFSAKLIDMV